VEDVAVVKQVEQAAQVVVVDVVLDLQATAHQLRPAVDLVIVVVVADQVVVAIKEQAAVAVQERLAVLNQAAPVVLAV